METAEGLEEAAAADSEVAVEEEVMVAAVEVAPETGTVAIAATTTLHGETLVTSVNSHDQVCFIATDGF